MQLNFCLIAFSLCYFVFAEAWRKIFDRIAKLREQHDVVKLHSLLLSGEEFFGLSDATVIRIVESVRYLYFVIAFITLRATCCVAHYFQSSMPLSYDSRSHLTETDEP